MTGHTDRQALDDLYNWPPPVDGKPLAPEPVWWGRRVWTTIKEDLFGEPYEPPLGDDVVLQRIRIHEKAAAGAKRLHKLSRAEAREILDVTAMLLGFEKPSW